MTYNIHSFPFSRHTLAVALALATGVAPASTIDVSSACTLVNAINNANSDTDTDGAGGCPAGNGADTLNLQANAIYTLTTADHTGWVEEGLPEITSEITINGNGATIQRSNEADTPFFRLIGVRQTGNLTLNKLQLTGGFAGLTNDTYDYPKGGAIGNDGILKINDSTISGNQAEAGGGGIVNYGGDITVTNSSFSDNNSLWDNWGSGGGGLMNISGNITLINSTISGNTAITGGGLTNGYDGGTVTLINSTISGNSATYGGGIYNSIWGGSLTLTQSTISDNSGSFIGGLSSGGSITLTNSIIANNTNGDGDCWGNAVSLQGINLIGDSGCSAPLSGDAKLRSLLDNGGLTLTHALKVDSPANAVADKTLCQATDQRAVTRPPQSIDIACDLGAFERKPLISSTVADIIKFFDAATANGAITGVNSFDELIATRNQLLTAGDYKGRNLAIQACSQLGRTLHYIDTDNSPEDGDYVTGSEAGALADEVTTLQAEWSCQ